MKNFKKSLFFIIISLILCFSALSLIGIKTRWGNTTTNHLKGYDSMSLGYDIGEEVNITLTSDEKLKEETNQHIQSIIKKRLDLCGFGESKIYKDKNADFLTVVLPYSYYSPILDFTDIAEYLTAKGELKMSLTESNEFSSLLHMDNKNKKSNISLTNSNVEGIGFFYYDDNKRSSRSKQKKNPCIKFKLDEKSYNELFKTFQETSKKRKELFAVEKEIRKLEKAKKENKNEDGAKNEEDEKILQSKHSEARSLREYITKQNFEVELDHKKIFNSNILEIFDDKSDEGNSIVLTSNAATEKQIFNYANIIKSGVMPAKMKSLQINKNSPPMGEHISDRMAILASILFVLFATLIVLKYRLIGALSVVPLIGHLGFMVATYSGFLSFLPGFCLNFPAAVGIGVSILIGISCLVFIVRGVVEKLKQNKDLHLSVNQTFKTNVKPIILFNIIIIIISFITMGVFAQTTDMFYYILKPLNLLLDVNSKNSVFSFSYSLFCGSLGVLIFEIILTNIILNYASTFKMFRKVNYMEAKTNEKKVK